MSISTHVLDTSRGRPAAGVRVRLERLGPQQAWQVVGEGVTDADGRLRSLLPVGAPPPGSYRLVFETGAYFDAQQIPSFYPHIIVTFDATEGTHYHVPLLLSPFGYSTYRGS